ncbi:unnamed protein product [Paramecium primaurelia]|uniref:Transmembrane protein n=1 Tax=Paramecium primaurelia TaxID=5886 RepID=A0A8S1QPP6_PARPR|nr:unnamed protein product [Paramecium primaurelia]
MDFIHKNERYANISYQCKQCKKNFMRVRMIQPNDYSQFSYKFITYCYSDTEKQQVIWKIKHLQLNCYYRQSQNIWQNMILILQTKNKNSLLSLYQFQYQFLSQKGVNFQIVNTIIFYILTVFLLKQQLSLWWIVLEPDFILKIYQIDNFFHRITVQFQFTYCSSFPSERNFIYLIDDTLLNSYSKSSHNFVRHKNAHSYDNLTIQWKCFRENNEPIIIYCGFLQILYCCSLRLTVLLQIYKLKQLYTCGII